MGEREGEGNQLLESLPIAEQFLEIVSYPTDWGESDKGEHRCAL